MQVADAAGSSWYETVEGPSLEQGDILPRCLVPVVEAELPPAEVLATTSPLPARADVFDVIVLSQSCDIAVQEDGSRKVDQVVLCPVWELPRLQAQLPDLNRRSFIDNVIRGRTPTWHALAPCALPGFERPHYFVELRRIFTIPVGWAEAVAARESPRLRLRSPWREQLAESVGRLFSRVAIPRPHVILRVARPPLSGGLAAFTLRTQR